MMNSSNFTENVASLCYNFFGTLPKTGKPKPEEWTVLSCIVKSSFDSELEVVSLGTGSKCIGVQKMSPRGDILNDSHAEIMARRGFLRYLYEQIELAFKSQPSIFVVNSDKKCALKSDVRFHLFTSQSPCGDGSIVEGVDQFAGGLHLHAVEIGPIKQLKTDSTNDRMLIEEHAKRSRPLYKSHELRDDDFRPPKKAKFDNCFVSSFDESQHPHKNAKLDEFPLFTTVDTIIDKNSIPSMKSHSENYPLSSSTTHVSIDERPQLPKKETCEMFSVAPNTVDKSQQNHESMLGRVRTKPGKGDPTASLSCSDKMARWLRVGIQGSLLSLFLDKPVHLDSIIVGGGCPFSKGALYRALVDRSFNAAYTNQWLVLEYSKPGACDECNLNLLKVPMVEQSTATFEFAKREGKIPSSASIVWSKVKYLPLEIAVSGKKQGTIKENKNKLSSALQISKHHFFKRFLEIATSPEFHDKRIVLPDKLTYKNVKAISEIYNSKWGYVKENFFNAWSEKPDLLTFSIDMKACDLSK